MVPHKLLGLQLLADRVLVFLFSSEGLTTLRFNQILFLSLIVAVLRQEAQGRRRHRHRHRSTGVR